jgi:hypothetical protein
VAVEWSTELVGLDQEADRVHAELKQPDGTIRKVTAAWVAGCDGARSTVRDLCRIAFEGAPYEHVFYLADTVMTGPMIQDELNVYLWPGGFHLFFPMRGENHWRVVGILPPSLRGRSDLTLDEVLPAIREEAGAGLAVQACRWFSTYRIHHRRAERFQERRCFVLGDAAHVHSPVGAQGMNTGLQDAYNLAWKLALVISGRADPALLESYEAERRPVAGRLLKTTDRLFTFIVSDSWLIGTLRTKLLPRMLALVMRFAKFRKVFFRTVSQIGIRYRSSALSQTLPEIPAQASQAGDRFPWLKLRLAPGGPVEDIFEVIDDTLFSLILVGQSAPPDTEALGDLRNVLVVPDDPDNVRELVEAHIPRPSFYLLRPDGYVGMCGARAEPSAISRYLSERLHVHAAGEKMSSRMPSVSSG